MWTDKYFESLKLGEEMAFNFVLSITFLSYYHHHQINTDTYCEGKGSVVAKKAVQQRVVRLS